MTTDTEATVEVQVKALVPRPAKDVIESEADSLPWTSYMNEQARCRKYIQEQFEPIKKAAKARHQAICDKEKTMLAEFLAGEADAKMRLSDWQIAEANRLAAEQRRLDEIARQEALAVAEAEGRTREASQIATGKIAVVSEQVLPPPKVAGLSVKQVKCGRIVDMAGFLRACLARRNGLSERLVLVDNAALDKLIQAMPEGTEFPGVVVELETKTRRTGRL